MNIQWQTWKESQCNIDKITKRSQTSRRHLAKWRSATTEETSSAGYWRIVECSGSNSETTFGASKNIANGQATGSSSYTVCRRQKYVYCFKKSRLLFYLFWYFLYFLASSIVGKSADNVSANVKVKVIKRQESNLTRRSLTKVREALKQERKPSKNESEDDDRSSTNSVLSEVADITNKQLSHSTILLADVSELVPFAENHSPYSIFHRFLYFKSKPL